MSARMRVSVDTENNTGGTTKRFPATYYIKGNVVQKAVDHFYSRIDYSEDISDSDISVKKVGEENGTQYKPERRERFLWVERDSIYNTLVLQRYIRMYFAWIIHGAWRKELLKQADLDNMIKGRKILSERIVYERDILIYRKFLQILSPRKLSTPQEYEQMIRMIQNKYNSKEGFIMWMKEHLSDDPDFSFSHPSQIIPRKVRKIMSTWKYTGWTLRETESIREKMHQLLINNELGAWCNTEEGLLKWMQENNIAMMIIHFWKIIPTEVRQKMNKWRSFGTFSAQDILHVNETISNMSLGDKSRYHSFEWFIEYLHSVWHKSTMSTFMNKLFKSTRAQFPEWKSVNRLRADKAYMYLQEWKRSAYKDDCPLVSYLHYRTWGGELEKIGEIFPIETFFENVAHFDRAQTSLWLEILGRYIQSAWRYLRSRTLSDRAFHNPVSFTDDRSEDSPLEECIPVDYGPEEYAINSDASHRVRQQVQRVPDQRIRGILLAILSDNDEVPMRDMEAVVIFFRENPDQWKLFRELLQPG